MLVGLFFILLLFLGWHTIWQFASAFLHPVHLLLDVAVICVLWHLAVKLIDKYLKPKPPVS